VGVNDRLLFARYGESGHFSPHTDGYTIIDFNKRSLYSFLIYLNDCGDGGATRLFLHDEQRSQTYSKDDHGRFCWPDSRCVGQAPVRTGSALLFYQDIPHEGEPVGPGCAKYIIRTDVFYERQERICDSPADREAYRLIREADLLEADGRLEEATKLYRRGVRLSPALASVFGL
jgi:hypothetical protein